MLKNIKIEGYKSIKKLDLELKPINILIGSNGVGKSNFISFFKLINNIYEQRLQQYSLKSGVDNLLYYGRKNTEKISGYLDFGSNACSFELKPTDEGKLFFSEYCSIYEGSVSFPKWCEFNKEEIAIKNATKGRDFYLKDYLEGCKIYHFHDTSITSALRSSSNIDDNKILRENGENLPSFLFYLQEKYPSNFKIIEKVIQSAVPLFEKFNLSPNKGGEEPRIKLEWIETEHPEKYFNAINLSDGSLRFIALTTLLLQPDLPKVIIIDEPELGLHPFAINKLAGMLKSASIKGCQVIVSTQSVNLLNNFEPEDIITVNKSEQSLFKRLDKDELKNWIDDYSIGDLWLKNVIKG